MTDEEASLKSEQFEQLWSELEEYRDRRFPVGTKVTFKHYPEYGQGVVSYGPPAPDSVIVHAYYPELCMSYGRAFSIRELEVVE